MASRFTDDDRVSDEGSDPYEDAVEDLGNIRSKDETEKSSPCFEVKTNTGSDLDVLLKQDSESGTSDSESEDDMQLPETTNVSTEQNGCDVISGKSDSFETEERLGLETEETTDIEGAKREEEEIEIDEEEIKRKEALLSDEEREQRRADAQLLKEEGNQEFKSGNYEAAMSKFTAAMTVCPLCYEKERSIMFSNRSACKFRMENYEMCIKDCDKTLELNPRYLKALLRRAESYERTEKLDEALEDYTKALEMDPSQHKVREACVRLPEEIKERNEKMKEEMLGKLKELGNMVLRPFGLSTNNFQLNQDPNSGSYSVNFVQSTDNGNKKS